MIDNAVIISPIDLASTKTNGGLIHIAFNSALMGFIDDMYISTYVYNPDQKLIAKRALKI